LEGRTAQKKKEQKPKEQVIAKSRQGGTRRKRVKPSEGPRGTGPKITFIRFGEKPSAGEYRSQGKGLTRSG